VGVPSPEETSQPVTLVDHGHARGRHWRAGSVVALLELEWGHFCSKTVGFLYLFETRMSQQEEPQVLPTCSDLVGGSLCLAHLALSSWL
jgi:hypothetical protein